VIGDRLLATGTRVVRERGRLLDAADPDGSVTGRSRLLCAALAELAVACYRGLGGRGREGAVADAAGLLSLLTKIDDQVIDAPSMHGAGEDARDAVERRVRAYLAPTLRSIVDARPADPSGRCALAAELGVGLRELAADDARLEEVLDVIAAGWAIQVQAVRVLSGDPARTKREDVEVVTAQISGLWLEMITLVGALPSDVRPLTVDERMAFEGWGAWIQRADALSDFGKDRDDGLRSSLPSYALSALAEPGPPYEALARHRIDEAMMPPPGALDALVARHHALGDVPSLLRWIHGFLTWRYLRDPASARALDDPAFAPFADAARDWEAYVRRVASALRAEA